MCINNILHTYIYIKYYIFGGGFGKLTDYQQIASKKISVSCVAPS